MSIYRNWEKDGNDCVWFFKIKFKDNNKLYKNLIRVNYVFLLWKNVFVKFFRFNFRFDKD